MPPQLGFCRFARLLDRTEKQKFIIQVCALSKMTDSANPMCVIVVRESKRNTRVTSGGMQMKEKIEKLLSEILSDKYDCVVRLRFEKKEAKE